MIIPCIDLMDGKVVQLVQGSEKALEGDSPDEMLRKFAAFPEIQVIDLDAALGRGIQRRPGAHAGIESRDPRRRRRAQLSIAREPWSNRAPAVIVGTCAFTKPESTRTPNGLRDAIGRDRLIIAVDSKAGRIVIKGWQEATNFTAEEVLALA